MLEVLLRQGLFAGVFVGSALISLAGSFLLSGNLLLVLLGAVATAKGEGLGEC